MAENQFFRISGKTGFRIRNFCGQKPPPDQDGANKKKVKPNRSSRSGGDRLQTYIHASIHANIVFLYNRDATLD